MVVGTDVHRTQERNESGQARVDREVARSGTGQPADQLPPYIEENIPAERAYGSPAFLCALPTESGGETTSTN